MIRISGLPASSEQALTVAMFQTDRLESQHFYGAHVVVQQLQDYLIRMAGAGRFDLVASPFQHAAALNYVSGLGGSHVVVRSYQDLITTGVPADTSIWFCPYGYDTRPFFVRDNLAARPYPVVAVLHGLCFQPRLHGTLLKILLGYTHPFDSLVCLSPAAKHTLVTLLDHVTEGFNRAHDTRLAYRGRIDILPNGIDTDLFRPQDAAAARRNFEIPPDAFVLLWFGRLSVLDKADLLPLLQVLRELVRENPRRRLLLVVAGSDPERYSEGIAARAAELGMTDHVRILTQVANPQDLYCAADVFVSPVDTLGESFGLTPVEAMACGVPQVVADWDGYRDTVVNGETGFLIPTYWTRCDQDLRAASELFDWYKLEQLTFAQSVAIDLAALRSRLQRLLDDEPLRRCMGEASRRRAVALFDWRVVAARYYALWQELAAEARASPPPRTAPGTRRSAYTEMPYFEAFRTHPTQILEAQDCLLITELGRQALEQRFTFPIVADSMVDFGLLWSLLQLLVAESAAHGLPIESVAAGAPAGAARPSVLRHLMWLLKYGLVSRTA